MIRLRKLRDRFTPVSFKLGVDPVSATINGIFGMGEAGVNAASVDSTNATNYQIAKETNEQQREMFDQNLLFQHNEAAIGREFNAVEAQKSRDFNAEEAEIARQFQSVEAQKTREWNAIDAQIDRAKAAGVNPALVAGQGQLSNAQAGGVAASGPAASGPVASGSGIPQLQVPTMQSKVGALTALSHLGMNITQSMKNKAEADNLKAKTKSEYTYQKYQDDLLDMGIKLNKAHEAKLYADINQVNAYVDQIQADIARIQAVTANLDADTAIKKIEEAFKSDECQALIDKLKSETGWNEWQVEYYKSLLPVQLGLYKSETALNAANAHAAEAAAHLSGEQASQVRALTSLYQTNNAQALLDYSINRTYGFKNAKEHYKQNQAQTDMMEYNANDAVQIIGTTTQVIGSVAGAAQSAAAVGVAGKVIKGGAAKTVRGFTQ